MNNQNINNNITWCEQEGHNIITICGVWCTYCKDFPKPLTYQAKSDNVAPDTDSIVQ